MNKKIFVTTANGFQGGAIARLLVEKGYTVSSLQPSLSTGNITKNGVQFIKGGLEDSVALSKALTNVDIAVYTFPLIFDLEKAKSYTENFIQIAIHQNINQVIFNTGFDLPKQSTELLVMDIKVAIAELLRASSLTVTTLVPDVYIDNLTASWSISSNCRTRYFTLSSACWVGDSMD